MRKNFDPWTSPGRPSGYKKEGPDQALDRNAGFDDAADRDAGFEQPSDRHVNYYQSSSQGFP